MRGASPSWTRARTSRRSAFRPGSDQSNERQQATTSGASASRDVTQAAEADAIGSEPLETLDWLDEDGRAADLHLDGVGHVELARLHDRRHRVHELLPGMAVGADDGQHVVDLIVLDAEQDRRVALLQEAAGRVEAWCA